MSQNPYAPPTPAPPEYAPRNPHDYVYATMRKRGALVFMGGLAVAAGNVFAIKVLHVFYTLTVVFSPGAIFFGAAMFIIGNRTPPVPKWIGRTILASGGIGLAIGVVIEMLLRAS